MYTTDGGCFSSRESHEDLKAGERGKCPFKCDFKCCLSNPMICFITCLRDSACRISGSERERQVYLGCRGNKG